MLVKSRTLVIGGAGFIGSHLVCRLLATGIREVTVVGRSRSPKFTLPKGVRYIAGDAGNSVFLEDLLADSDEVIDLAYATVPKTSFDDPVHDVLANLPATVSLLKQASKHSLRRIILVSSGGTVYGSAAYLPIDESHPTNPVSPYGITKLAAEKYALLFHRLEGLPVVIARPGNPYGPNQMGNIGQGFIGTAMLAVLKRQKITLFGNRGTIRDYIYIDDLTDGLIAALDYGTPGEVYNIGTGVGTDNRAILDLLGDLAYPAGYTMECTVEPARSFDVSSNVLSSARLTYVSGWRPHTSLNAGLATTWDWALENGAQA
ncbi:NAD-dependent epimerase/dehydratase family protein [Alcaligenaceae bacterium]|nr:NAD-dependent epimerase/dehydratase family protein [Alcaligenaceae bacterium]